MRLLYIIFVAAVIVYVYSDLRKMNQVHPKDSIPLMLTIAPNGEPPVEEFSPPKHSKEIQNAKLDTLRIIRKNSLNQPNLPVLDKTIKEIKVVQEIY